MVPTNIDAQGVPVPQGHPDVADDHDPDGQSQPVVHEGGPGAPAQRPGVVPAHDHPGPEHHQAGPGDEGGVELLAGVELPDPQRRAAPMRRSGPGRNRARSQRAVVL